MIYNNEKEGIYWKGSMACAAIGFAVGSFIGPAGSLAGMIAGALVIPAAVLLINVVKAIWQITAAVVKAVYNRIGRFHQKSGRDNSTGVRVQNTKQIHNTPVDTSRVSKGSHSSNTHETLNRVRDGLESAAKFPQDDSPKQGSPKQGPHNDG